MLRKSWVSIADVSDLLIRQPGKLLCTAIISTYAPAAT